MIAGTPQLVLELKATEQNAQERLEKLLNNISSETKVSGLPVERSVREDISDVSSLPICEESFMYLEDWDGFNVFINEKNLNSGWHGSRDMGIYEQIGWYFSYSEYDCMEMNTVKEYQNIFDEIVNSAEEL